MSNPEYKIRETENKRWGIYLQDRLLATVGSYEACQFLGQSLTNKLSNHDKLKAAIAYKKALSRYSPAN